MIYKIVGQLMEGVQLLTGFIMELFQGSYFMMLAEALQMKFILDFYKDAVVM